MRTQLLRLVWRRAKDAGEYCGVGPNQAILHFQVDHVIARQHGGLTNAENLALSCLRCNRYKGPNIAAIDPQTGALTRLFHPRLDAWEEHFVRIGPEVIPLTPVARATVQLLHINDPVRLLLRGGLAGD